MILYDYMIIGAGPAGTFAAAMLAQKGRRAIVLERREKGYCKLCGDGISVRAVHTLRRSGFPVERLEKAGAVPIKTIYHRYGDRTDRLELSGDERRAYALSRKITDALFREYCVENGAEIRYGENVRDVTANGGFRYKDIAAKRLIIACGVASNIHIGGERLLPFRDRPVGVSMTVSGKRADSGFYFFDMLPECRGTYAWIFTLGGCLYNTGIWLKEDRRDIRRLFDRFLTETAPLYCGAFTPVTRLRGALMGIGEPFDCRRENVYVIGDAANTSGAEDGEGISRAIISAAELVSSLC